jgi:acyl-CoA thioesterase
MSYEDEKAHAVAAQMMLNDRFSQWLGITVLDVRDGYCKLQAVVRAEMANGFGIAHGGIAFSIADSAFAFACNSDGRMTLALDANISFTRPAKVNDTLTAEAKKINKTKKTGLYIVEITNQHLQLVALFKGTCYTPTPLSQQAPTANG